MKHLKTKEEYLHGGSYTRMDSEDFDKFKENSKDKREPFTKQELDWFESKGLLDENTRKRKDVGRLLSVGTTEYVRLDIIKWGFSLKISKYQDEWYYVIAGRGSETTTSDFGFRKYFKCDQFDGLQALVEKWIGHKGNLKSKDLK